MKHLILSFFLIACTFSVTLGQSKNLNENVVITSQKGEINVRINENGELLVNVPPKDVRRFKANGVVRYSDFGAKGDGKTDDINAKETW